MIEMKLSQGAKPGHGGVLPGAKVTAEIAEARGVPVGVDCISPARHSAFSTPIEMLQFVARLRELSGGKPTGFKLAIGHPWEWFGIVKAMQETGITPDFIVVDGGEGGTGAAPLEFTDHVGAPLREALMLVHNTLVGTGLRDRDPASARPARSSPRSISCAPWRWARTGAIRRAASCSRSAASRRRPATPAIARPASPRRTLNACAHCGPGQGRARVYNFHQNTMKALKELLAAAGLSHSDEIGPEHVLRRIASNDVRTYATIYPWTKPNELGNGGVPDHPVFRYFWDQSSVDSFAPPPSVLAVRDTRLR